MKSVTPSGINHPFTAQLSSIKLELSKYRVSQPKTDTTKKQPQSVAKPMSFQSRKGRVEQTDTKGFEPRQSVAKSHIMGRAPSFSVFFSKEEDPSLTIPTLPSLSEVFVPTEQDVSEVKVGTREKSLGKKKGVEVVQLKESAKNLKNKKQQQQPKVQVWSFLDLSDKEDDEAVAESNTNKAGFRKSLRNTECPMATSYMTTLPDEECARDDNNRRCNTENSDTRAVMNQNTEEILRLNKRVKELEEKNGKWELFGRLLAKCYQATRKESRDYKMQNELDKKTIAALKEQVCTLKTLSRAEKANTAKAVKKAAQESEENKLCILTLKGFEKKLIAFNNENKKLKNQINHLKEENKELKTCQESIEKYKTATEHYKAMAEGKLKECSSLAEEIICLRTDLDRLHLKYVKAQKELLGSITPPAISKNTSDEEKGVNKLVQTRNRTKSMDRNTMERILNGPSVECSNVKQVTFCDALEDIDTPSPRTFKMMPLRKEADVLIKE